MARKSGSSSSSKPPAAAASRPKGIQPSELRTRAPRPISRMVDRLTKGMLGRQGFAHGAIVSQWPDIVGADMARHTQPEKIVFSRDGVSGGTVHLRCDSGALATELQHLEPQILERINMFFGYQAVVRIKLIQAPLPRPKGETAPPPKPLSRQEAQALADQVASVDDPELRAALERLGQSVIARKGHAPEHEPE